MYASDDPSGPFITLTVLLWLVTITVTMLISWWLMRSAFLSALRKHSTERDQKKLLSYLDSEEFDDED